MSVERHVFKLRHFVCRECGERRSELAWSNDHVECCGQDMDETNQARGRSAAVHGDEIDEICDHGICHDDGSPRRVRSRQEKKRLLAEKGLTIVGDTPEPNRGRWF